MNKKLNEKYRKLMLDIINMDDYEIAHGMADDYLCLLLDELGYKEVVELYGKVGKWYA